MPVLKLQARDEEPLEDASEGFAGGQWSQGRRSRLAANQAHRLQNVMLWDATGRATTRRGAQHIGDEELPGPAVDGLGYFDTPDLERLVRVKNGLVEEHENLDPTEAWATVAGWTPEAGEPCAIVQGIAGGDQVLFFSNGVDPVQSWDGSSFTSEAAIPLGRAIGWHTNRLIVAAVDTDPDTIFFSDILDGQAGYDVTKRIRVGAGDGDPIATWRPWYGTIIAVFKRGSAWLVDVNPATAVGSMRVDRVPHARGLVARQAVAEAGNDLLYLASDYRVASLKRYLEAGAEVQVVVSNAVSNEIDNINRAAAHEASAVSYGTRTFFMIPTVVPGYPHVLSYNNDLKVWEGYWNGWTPLCWAVSYAGGQPQLNWGDDVGRVLRWRDANPEVLETEEDHRDPDWFNATQAIRTSIETRNHTWQAAQNAKRPLHVEIEFAPGCTAERANLWLIRDETVQPQLGFVDPRQLRASLNLLHELPGREFGLRIESPAGKLSVAAVRWSAFLETVQLVAPAGFDRATPGDGWTPEEPSSEPVPVLLPAVTLDGAGDFSGELTVVSVMPAVTFDGDGDLVVLAYGGWVWGILTLESTDEAAHDAASGDWVSGTGP